MRCLVTGASGFVGRHLCRELERCGHSVAALGTDECCDYRVDVRDRDAVAGAVREAAPSAVYHLAAVAYVPYANADPETADAVNADGTVNVLDAAAAVGARALAVSSGAVYGRVPADRMPITEEFELAPVDVYARSKAAAETACVERAASQSIVRVRPFNLTGPGQSREYVCSDFASQIAAAEAAGHDARLRVGDLSSERDFSDVRDAVGAYVAALERGRPGDVYNICSGRPVAISRILDILASCARVRVDVEVQETKLRPDEVKRYYGSARKLQDVAGWRCTIALERTLGDLLDDWRVRLSAGRAGERS